MQVKKFISHFYELKNEFGITTEKYYQYINQMQTKLKIIRDKVRPHTSQQIIAKLTDLKYKLLQNPPDLPPTDYHFFKHFELFLGNRHFENEENHKSSIVEFIDLKDQNFFKNGTKNSLEKCIETNRAYFD